MKARHVNLPLEHRFNEVILIGSVPYSHALDNWTKMRKNWGKKGIEVLKKWRKTWKSCKKNWSFFQSVKFFMKWKSHTFITWSCHGSVARNHFSSTILTFINIWYITIEALQKYRISFCLFPGVSLLEERSKEKEREMFVEKCIKYTHLLTHLNQKTGRGTFTEKRVETELEVSKSEIDTQVIKSQNICWFDYYKSNRWKLINSNFC